MKRYSLYDVYETEIFPGELICTSDDMAEIRQAAKQRHEDTDGECELYVLEPCEPGASMTCHEVMRMVKRLGYDWGSEECKEFLEYNLERGRTNGWEFAARNWEERRKKHSALR